MAARSKLETWSLALLGSTVLVILWGAYVRVTGSGAGCADHWPLCNGELVPRAPRLETLIELTHRLTSGIAGLLSIVVVWLAFRHAPAGARVRKAAVVSLVLMLVEGAIGALLVKQGLVAKNASEARALVVGLHLANTFLLLAAQLLTWHFARGGAALDLRARPLITAVLLGILTLTLVVASSGAITALGDTLFPVNSLAEGVRQDMASDAHFLVRLRVWHPLLAMLTGAVVVYGSQYVRQSASDPRLSRLCLLVACAFGAQLVAGLLNVLLLAPALMQVTHLLLADVLWLLLVQLTAHALAVSPAGVQPSAGLVNSSTAR